MAPCCPRTKAYSCYDVACTISVYGTSPGVPSRTILVKTPSEYLLPPRSTRTSEGQIPAHVTVGLHTVELDSVKIIAAGGAMGASGVYEFEMQLSENSADWGTHTETATIRVDMDCYEEEPAGLGGCE
jgi:hypothetical protein